MNEYIKQLVEAARYVNTIRPHSIAEDIAIVDLMLAIQDLMGEFGHTADGDLLPILREIVRHEAEVRNISFIEAVTKIRYTIDNMYLHIDDIKDSENPHIKSFVSGLRMFKNG